MWKMCFTQKTAINPDFWDDLSNIFPHHFHLKTDDSWDYPGTEAVAVGHPFAGRNEAGDHCALDVAKGFIRIVAATLW